MPAQRNGADAVDGAASAGLPFNQALLPFKFRLSFAEVMNL
jgi:hypothetical protein